MRDQLEFKMTCLNCLKIEPSFVKHNFQWDNFLTKTKLNNHPATWNYYAINNLKREFFLDKRKCEYCSYEGAYYIYDLCVNGDEIYHFIDENLPQIKMEYFKEDGIINGDFRMKGDLLAISSMLEVANGALNHPHPSIYIPKLMGNFKMITFQYDDDFCDVNFFQSYGFSYNEIETLLKSMYQKLAELADNSNF